jgi:beta-mannosidase
MICVLTAPDGTEHTASAELNEGTACAQITIKNPQLWWCNGLGEQPLYSLRVILQEGGEPHDCWENKIGLRTIELDTAPDEWGTQFRFLVNGVPIFAKGANHIPQDSMFGRSGNEQLVHLIHSAKSSNMNMLRVWGGGYYESNEFYRLCDENGLLVWQDCAFACALYPLDEEEYCENVRQEIADNVRRLRHHASLALWNGNNEIQSAARGYIGQKALLEAHNRFFFETLRAWIGELDGMTPYWPSSPSNGDGPKKPGDYNRGDTHLWTVWHGCLPIEAYRKMPTRFCSEYGVESFPAWETLEKFAESPEELSLFSPTMLTHQKCRSGNAKMRYYILSKFREPRDFRDFAVLSQILQAEAMRHAADFWRCNMGRCNGSLYWQFNDCWPTASWAGIDYFGCRKALQYRARHFNAPQSAIALLSKKPWGKSPLYIVNEKAETLLGTLRWRVVSLAGGTLLEGTLPVDAPGSSSTLLGDLAELSGWRPLQRPQDCAVQLELLNAAGQLVHRQHYLPVRDKKAHLLPPKISVTQTAERGGEAYFTLTARHYARFVHLAIPGVNAPLSDNFFDIPGGESVSVSVPLPEGKTAAELAESLQIRSVADIPQQGTPLRDSLVQLSILLNPKTHSFRNYPQREWETR